VWLAFPLGSVTTAVLAGRLLHLGRLAEVAHPAHHAWPAADEPDTGFGQPTMRAPRRSPLRPAAAKPTQSAKPAESAEA
jgi:hypothetical protein